jgi:hypothetical protein
VLGASKQRRPDAAVDAQRAAQRGGRTLERAALETQHLALLNRVVQQRLLLGHVQPGGCAQVVARADQAQRAPL